MKLPHKIVLISRVVMLALGAGVLWLVVQQQYRPYTFYNEPEGKLIDRMAVVKSIASKLSDENGFTMGNESEITLPARKYIQNSLRDPSSGQFRNLYISYSAIHDSWYVCGEVNGTNAYGGYAGFQPFSVSFQYSQLDQAPVFGGIKIYENLSFSMSDEHWDQLLGNVRRKCGIKMTMVMLNPQ